MPDTEVKQLYNRSSLAQSGGDTSLAPLIVGLVFMTVGLGVMAGAYFLLRDDPNAPPVFVGVAFGGSFFFAGLLVFSSGIRGMLAHRSKVKRAALRAQFWDSDYPW